MARKSTSSSAPTGNGKPVTSDTEETVLSPAGGQTKAITNELPESRDDSDDNTYMDRTRGRPIPCDSSLYPGGSRSLTAIGEQAFFLGFMFAISLATLLWLTLDFPHPMWRLSAFIGCLSVFHFLEYETTARYNLVTLRAESFLLFTNGKAYNIAYGMAILEMVVSSFYFPIYQASYVNEYTIATGLALVVIGQVVRSTAMCQAGTNFNHTPATTKREGHELVTKGIYGWLRHPSYFGFFYWAVGTQLLVGNKACLLGYVLVLWNFFKHRIVGEEKKLTEFFGKDYEKFREKTPTGIPLIS